ncbi:MAG: ATP-binding cassette domain-containing protein [Bacillota bacterium]|nr:ATP-binding cassette domain-containing protein [Bacillota bacterium]
MAFIELKNVSFTYPEGEEPAIRNLSLQVEKGQFVVLFGSSGSGKSTLLRLLKEEIKPYGKLDGEIRLNGSPETGFVFQDPENQVVAEEVLHELVFGLENIGLSTNEMRGRVAELVHFFGLEPLLHQKMQELSGGKKQQINLASVLLMQPDLLLLDEPTSQLDPVSTRELLDILVRLNDEFGMTIILAEHRLEEVFTLADKMIMMEKGEITVEGSPREVLKNIWNSPLKAYVPSIPSLFFARNGQGEVPLTVKDGRKWIQSESVYPLLDLQQKSNMEEEVVRIRDIFFRYDRKKDYILDSLHFSIMKGEFYTLLGGNGSGKSTLLKAIGGMLKPESGKIDFKQNCKLGYLPQNPKLFFIQDTVQKEIQDTMKRWGISNRVEIDQLIEDFEIKHILNHHPYDISGGELQKAAILCLLIRKPDFLLLDEPTKGLDPVSKEKLAKLLKTLNSGGVTILMSTHDIEFAGKYATKCGMMFQGKITSEGEPVSFFKGNFFYTTMLHRLFRGLASPAKEKESCEF